MTKQSGKSMYVAAIALLGAGFSYLMFSGFSSNAVYLMNVAEALTIPEEKLVSARLLGIVGSDIIAPAENQNRHYVRFCLLDKIETDKSLWVEYYGTVPNIFKAGIEVIVEGRLSKITEAQGIQIFKATTLITKCPSKYQKIH